MAEEFTVPEPYDSTNIDNRQQGYSPASSAGDGLDPALASALGSNASKSMSDIFREVDAENEARYKPQAIQAAKRISAFNAFEKRHKDTMFDIQKQNLALQWESAQRRRREVESALRQNGYMYANTNPDEEAMINGIASTLGVSVEAVRSNPEEYKRRLSAQQLAKLAVSNPSVSSFMTDQQNASIAHDDVENMSALEYGWSIVKDIGRALVAGVAESPKTVVGAVYQYGVGASQASEMEMLSANPEAISGDEYTDRLQSAQDEVTSTGFMETAKDAYQGIKDLGDWIQGDRWQQYGIIGRGIVSGTRSLGNQVLPFKGGKLFSALPLVAGGLAENTNAFMEDIAQGRGYGTAAAHGAFSGSVEALTEKIPMSWWMSDAAKALPFWKKLAKGWARETPTELIATTFQNLADVSAETAGYSFGDFITGNMESKAYGDMFSKYWRELPTALAETAVSVFPMSLGFSGLSYHRQAKAAEQGRRAIEAIQDAGKKSKLLARDQDTYRKLARTVTEDKGITEVGIEKGAWDSYFQNNVGVDPAQAAKEFGIENYDEADVTDHIAMKPDVYTADFCKAGHIPALADFTTLQNGETLTINEVNERAKEIASQAAREIEAIKQSEKVDDKWADVSNIINNVEEQIRYELEGAGMTLKSADIQAKLMSRFLTTTLVRNAVQLAGEQNREVDTKEIAKSIRDEIFGKGFQITRGNLVARKNVEPHLDSLLEKLRKSNPAKMARQAYGETLAQFVRRNGGLIPTKDLRDKVSNGELPQSIISKKSKNGADTMALLAKEAGYSFNEETRQIDDDLVEQLMEEHKGGQVNYSMANRNDALAMEIAVLGSLQTDIGIAGIDLNNTEDAEVRRLLAEFDGEKYGREDSRAVPETEETGGQVESLYQERKGFVANKNATQEELDEAERQYNEVKDFYSKHPELYMKAPNGKDSNLSEEEWITVRTENFKKWAGDWEKAGVKDRLENQTPIHVDVVHTGDSHEIKKNEAAKLLPKSDTVQKIIGTVVVSRNGVRESVHHSRTNEKLDVIPRLKEIAEQSEYLGAMDDLNGLPITNHYFATKINHDGADKIVFLRVREKGNTKNFYVHDVFVEDDIKQKVSSLQTSPQSWKNFAAIRGTDLYKAILQDIYSAGNTTKILDENGEPKVMYHGTNAYDLQVFKLGKKGYLGGAIYLTEDRKLAERYTDYGTVIESFVNARNPLVVETNNPQKEILTAIHGEKKAESLLSKREAKDSTGMTSVTKADIKKLLELGYDSIEWKFGREELAVFDPNQIKSATGNAGTFKQDNDNIYYQQQYAANGATRIMRDANGVAQHMHIELYKTANFSTFAHESSHFMLEVISGMVAEGRASQYLNGEFDTIMKYLGTDKESWLSMDAKEKEDYHEKFARSFERYLLEGKAPIPELRSIFRVFKDWLTYIYRNLKTLDFKLSKDITDVFDRMIASDEEIARAKSVDNLSMLASSAEDLGVSQQEYKALSNMMNEELAVATEKVRARMLKSEVRKQQKQYKAEKAKAQKQAEKEWNDSDFVQTINYFTDSEDRTRALNKQALVATYGEEFIKTLPKINGKSVYHESGTCFPDEMASDLGFESSEDFIKAIAEMQPKKQWVEERTQQIIDDFFGDTVNSAEVSETVDEAMNNSAKEERLTMELKILNKAKRFADVGRKSERRETKQANKEARDAGKAVDKETSEMVEAMKLAADTFVKETNMRDFNPNKWLNAMRKWSRRAKQELMKAKPDYAKAMEYKRSELCSYYSYVYSVKAKDAIRKKTAEARNILRKPLKDILKTRTAGIVYHAKSVAAKLLGRDATQWEEKARIEMKYEDGIDADQTITAMKDMTVEQAIANLNYCSGLWELSRRDQQMRVNDKLYDIEMVKKELSETIKAFGKTNREYNSREGAADTFKRLYGNALVDLTRMESWCDMVDGNEVGKETGALTRYMFAPMKICAENSRRKQAQYNKRLADILEKVQVGKGTIKADELNGFLFGEKTGYAKLEIFHALLHCGNKSNMERLIIGRGWGQYLADGSVDTTQWSKFVQRLTEIGYITEADMDAVQEIWDLFDELKPEMQKANKEVFGNYFDEIEPDQFEMFGKTYKGGYVPAIYDPELSDAGKNQELDPADLMNAVSAESGGVLAKLQAGWRNTRVKGVAGALLLDVSKLGTHLNQQIQFAEIAPTAKYVAKVISSEEFRNAIDGYDPFFYQNVIVPWFSRAVTQNVSGQTGVKRTEEEKLLQRIRNRAGIATMFFNVVNALEGFVDLTAVYSKVKAAHIHDAFKQMATNRKATVESVLEMSPYMKERLRSEANAAMEKLDQALRPSKLRKVENWMADHAYFLQEMVDGFTAPTAWLAAYNQASENGIAHEEAVLQADSVVRQTFGTNQAEDLANRETGGIWKRLFTQFTGYFVQRANLIAGKLTKISDSDMAIADKRKSVFFLLLQSVFLPAWIGGVIRKAAMGAAPWDEDEDGNSLFAQWMKDVFGWTVASYVVGLGGVTVFGRVASTAIDAYTSERMASGRIFSTPMMKPIEDVMKIAAGVVSKKDGTVNINKLVNATAGAANLVPILPVIPNRVMASGKYIVKSATGDIKPTGAVDFVRGAITGKASDGTESKR